MKRKILVATNNQGKFKDLMVYLRDLPYNFVSLHDLRLVADVEETGKTFEENAVLKARFFSELSGLPVIADDSGLEIDALNGEPGVYSARYAGENANDEQRIDYILKKMLHVPDEKRIAGFRTVIAFAHSPENILTFEGECSGILTREPVGPMIPGLPYCCLLYLPSLGKSVSQLITSKQQYPSQRGIALKKLAEYLQTVS